MSPGSSHPSLPSPNSPDFPHPTGISKTPTHPCLTLPPKITTARSSITTSPCFDKRFSQDFDNLPAGSLAIGILGGFPGETGEQKPKRAIHRVLQWVCLYNNSHYEIILTHKEQNSASPLNYYYFLTQTTTS